MRAWFTMTDRTAGPVAAALLVSHAPVQSARIDSVDSVDGELKSPTRSNSTSKTALESAAVVLANWLSSTTIPPELRANVCACLVAVSASAEHRKSLSQIVDPPLSKLIDSSLEPLRTRAEQAKKALDA